MPKGNPIDLNGQKFGKWTVIGPGPYSFTSKKRRWICRCECGREGIVPTGDLRNGESKSCSSCKRATHRMSGTREFWIWHGMKKRCLNQNHKWWHCYGGRGIKVCDRWLNSFESFMEDMGPRPSRKHSIERINNNGNYEPSNCKWGTTFEQNRNKRTNRRVTINGRTQCAVDWSDELGLSKSCFLNRIKHGWSGEALLRPSKKAHHV